jgi:hypothetical protein
MRSSFVRAMAYQSIAKFLPSSRWFARSLLFVTDMFGDLNLQEHESREVVGSSNDHLPLAPVRVSHVNEAQLWHKLGKLGEMDLNPSRDKTDHTLAIHAAITDPIHRSPSESDFEDDIEVYMVGQGDQPPERTAEEIQRETEEEFTRAAPLARDAERGKRHNGLWDDSGVSNDELRDGAPTRRCHPKFKSRRPAG